MANPEPLLKTFNSSRQADGIVAQEKAQADSEEAPAKCSRKVVLGFVLLVSLIAGAVYVAFMHKHDLALLWHAFLHWCKKLGWQAALMITVGTWTVTSVGLPASGFFVGAAAVFASLYGPALGATIAIVSCGLGFWSGCVTAFVLARHYMKPLVEERLEKIEAMQIVNIIIEEEGWKFAFLMRLSPFLPVEVFNFACALTSMSFSQNAIACLGSIPTASFEIWMYAQVTNAAMSGEEGGSGRSHFLIMLAVNIPIIILLVLVVCQANRKYREKVEMKSSSHQEVRKHKEVLQDRATFNKHLRRAATMQRLAERSGTNSALRYMKRTMTRPLHPANPSLPTVRQYKSEPNYKKPPPTATV